MLVNQWVRFVHPCRGYNDFSQMFANKMLQNKNFNWNVLVSSIPIDWSKKKICHAHSNAHNA